jgi:hypothetical protein
MGRHGINNNSNKNAYKKTNKKATEPHNNKKSRKRQVLSYENVPIDEYEEYNNNKSFKVTKKLVKRIVIIVVIIAVLSATVFLVANRKKLTWDNISLWFSSSDGEGYPTDIVGTTVSKGNFTLVDGRLSYASDTSYIELDSNAGEIINSQLSYSNPVVRGTRTNTIVYGVGSDSYMIHNTKKMVHKGTTENGIYTADINDDGYYAVVTGGGGYLSVLTAYNDNNKQLYEYSFADYYITCVALNKSGSGAICCGVTSDNGAEKTKVYVLDFSKEKPANEYELTESVIYDMSYVSSDTVCAVANNAVYTIDVNEKTPDETDFNSRTLTSYYYNTDTNTLAVSLSRSGDGRNCDILSFNSNGEKEYEINSDYRVDSLCLYKGTLGIIAEGKGYILDETGAVVSQCDAGDDAQTLMLNSSDTGYILGLSEIRTVEFQ